MTKSAIGISLAVVIAVGLSVWFMWGGLLFPQASLIVPQTSSNLISEKFVCSDGKTIMAEFSPNAVRLTLENNRTVDLAQATSASSARYTNADGSFVFLSDGQESLIEENGTTTYSGCVTVVSETSQ